MEVSQHYGRLDAEACRSFVEKHSKIKEDLAYDIYQLEDSTILVEMLDRKQEVVEGFEDWAAESNMDLCMKVSDYNKLRGFLGKEPISLSDDEYAVQTQEAYYRKKLEKGKRALVTGGRTYRLSKVLEGPFAQDSMNESGFGTKTILVLPDAACALLTQGRGCYAAMVEDPGEYGLSGGASENHREDGRSRRSQILFWRIPIRDRSRSCSPSI